MTAKPTMSIRPRKPLSRRRWRPRRWRFGRGTRFAYRARSGDADWRRDRRCAAAQHPRRPANNRQDVVDVVDELAQEMNFFSVGRPQQAFRQLSYLPVAAAPSGLQGPRPSHAAGVRDRYSENRQRFSRRYPAQPCRRYRRRGLPSNNTTINFSSVFNFWHEIK